MQLSEQMTVERILTEITDCYGYVPPFFASAQETLPVLEQLWQQTKTSYKENPLPMLFKEKLLAYLSRYCRTSYCVVYHSCLLHALELTGPEILALLESPAPTPVTIERHLATLTEREQIVPGWPKTGPLGPSLEHTIIACAAYLFIYPRRGGQCRELLRSLLGSETFNYLTTLLTYTKTYHFWLESQSDITYMDDLTVSEHLSKLVAEEPRLPDFFQNYGKKVRKERNKQEEQLIAERQRVLEELQISEQRFRATFDQAAVGIAHVGLAGQWLRVNQKLCDIVGYTQEEMRVHTFQDITHPDDIERDLAHVRQSLAGEIQTYSMEKRYIRKDGNIVWVFLTVALVHRADGAPDYFISVIEDFSERKQLEQLLLKSEFAAAAHAHRLEAIFEAMTDGVVIYDNTGNILQINAAYRKFIALAIRPEHALLSADERGNMLDLRDEQEQPLPLEKRPVTRMLRGEIMTGDNTMDIVVRALDGRRVQLEVSGTAMRDGNGQITGGVLIFRDVTGRRELERRTHNALNALLKIAETLVQIPDTGDDSEAQRTGSAANSIRQRLAELTRSIMGGDRVTIVSIVPETEQLLPVAAVGFTPEHEQKWWEVTPQTSMRSYFFSETLSNRLRAGEVLILDTTQPPLRDMLVPYKVRALLIAAMHIGNQLTGILTLDYGEQEHDFTPEEISLAEAIARLIALVIERDRLLQERTEARANELALREANQRMDEFMGIASHELKTPMTTIKGYVQLVTRRLRNAQRQEWPDIVELQQSLATSAELLERSDSQITRLTRLVNELLDVSRIQANRLEFHKEPCDLAAIVRETVQNQQHEEHQRTIILEFPAALDSHLLLCFADADRIGQVVANYLSNALKYSPPDTPIIVHLTVEGDMARVSIHDEGPGLAAEEQERIWERFYRVEGIEVQSGSGIGLGLGLHICRTIIERHGGQVGVISTPGGGSTFWFTVPLARKTAM